MEPERRSRRRRVELLWGLAAAVLSTLVGLWALDAWGDLRTGVPLYYAGALPARFAFDLNGILIPLQGLIETGWFQHHDRLGAPFGLELYDFPLGPDHLQFLLLKVLALGAQSVGTLANLYLLLTFPLVAGVAYGVFRALSVSRPTAALMAVLFAVLPYHFVRGEYHLLLSNYLAVPLGAGLVVAVLRGDRLLGPKWRTWRTLAVVAACVVLGSTGSYYATLTMMLLGLAAPLAALLHRRWSPLVVGGLLCAAIGLTVVANTIPSLAYWADEGRNPITAKREAGESELYSLKLTQLVLPSSLHRIDAVGDFGARYSARQTLADEGTASLGLIGTIGFVWLLVFAAAQIGGRPLRVPHADVHRSAALGAVLGFAVGTTGGISALVAYYVSPQLRAYNRVSVFIAFFALLAVGLLVDAGLDRLRARGRPAALLGVALLAVGVVGVLDQTGGGATPSRELARAAWVNDQRFGEAAERLLPSGAQVFQLPIMGYPESPPILGMVDYEHAKGILHSRDLRWSYGGMKGRAAAEWQTKLVGTPNRRLMESVAAAGFSALYVDRLGFDPPGDARLRADATRLAGPPAVTSGDGRLVLYDLRPLAERLRRRLGEPAFARLGAETLRAPAPPPGPAPQARVDPPG